MATDLPAEEDVADTRGGEKAQQDRGHELTFVRFLLGGLIFGSYARALGGVNMLCSRSARASLLSAMIGKSGEYEDALLLR